MQKLWIDGREVALTPRQELRVALFSGRTMDQAETDFRRGLMSRDAFKRYERIWAWSTATEHPITAGVPTPRWSSRRGWACRAIRAAMTTEAKFYSRLAA